MFLAVTMVLLSALAVLVQIRLGSQRRAAVRWSAGGRRDGVGAWGEPRPSFVTRLPRPEEIAVAAPGQATDSRTAPCSGL